MLSEKAEALARQLVKFAQAPGIVWLCYKVNSNEKCDLGMQLVLAFTKSVNKSNHWN